MLTDNINVKLPNGVVFYTTTKLFCSQHKLEIVFMGEYYACPKCEMDVRKLEIKEMEKALLIPETLDNFLS